MHGLLHHFVLTKLATSSIKGLILLVSLKVRWRPVIWGIGMQFVIGLILLRWRPGLEAFKFIGEQVERFFEHTDAGSKTMFGDPGYLDHPLVMKVRKISVYQLAF